MVPALYFNMVTPVKAAIPVPPRLSVAAREKRTFPCLLREDTHPARSSHSPDRIAIAE